MICPSCCHTNLPGDDVCGHCKQPLTPFDLPQPENPVERSVMYDQVDTLKQNPPVMIGQTATVGQAMALMQAENVGGADRRWGRLARRDFQRARSAQEDRRPARDYADLPITQFMTPRPECVKTTDTLNFVLQKMDAGGYRHVPVLQDGKPVSIISARDMLRFVTRLCRDA